MKLQRCASGRALALALAQRRMRFLPNRSRWRALLVLERDDPGPHSAVSPAGEARLTTS